MPKCGIKNGHDVGSPCRGHTGGGATVGFWLCLHTLKLVPRSRAGLRLPRPEGHLEEGHGEATILILRLGRHRAPPLPRSDGGSDYRGPGGLLKGCFPEANGPEKPRDGRVHLPLTKKQESRERLNALSEPRSQTDPESPTPVAPHRSTRVDFLSSHTQSLPIFTFRKSRFCGS